MPTRSAKANWSGTLKEGKGVVQFGDFSEPYNFGGRIAEERIGVTAEELIAAAVSSCYNLALAVRLTNQGLTIDDLDTSTKVILSTSGLGFKISRISIVVTARIKGITAEEFKQHAQVAKDTCPVINALAAVATEIKTELANS